MTETTTAMFGVVSQSLAKRLMLIVNQAPMIASSVMPTVANLIERTLRTPANCEMEAADVSMLHWSELHD